MPTALMAFDLGASGGRCLLGEYDGAGLNITEQGRFSTTPLWDGRHYVRDMDALGTHVDAWLSSAPPKLRSVGIGCFGADFILTDEHQKPLRSPIHHHDPLPEGLRERLFRRIAPRELYKRTGQQNLAANALFRLMALREEDPSLFQKAGEAYFIPDYLNLLLTGLPSCELSAASAAGMLDLHSRRWDDGLMATAGLTSGLFADPVGPGRILGGLRGREDIRVVSVCGSHTASSVLALPLRPRESAAFLDCGSRAAMGVVQEDIMTHEQAFRSGFSNRFGYGKHVSFERHMMGQWIADEIKREYRFTLTFDETDTLMASQPMYQSFIDPEATEFKEPGRMQAKLVSYCKRTGQNIPEDLGAMLRCVADSLAFAYRQALESLELVLGYRFSKLYVVGGGVRNRPLMRSLAAVLARPVVAGAMEAGAAGSLGLQLIALGELESEAQLRTLIYDSFPTQTYAPERETEAQEAYGRYLRITGALQ